MIDKWCKTQNFTDIHCHCLPGLDDGPTTIEETLTLCRALITEGISTVIATPHQLGRFESRNSAEHVRKAVWNLNQRLRNDNVPLNVVPGAEVRVDERICRLLEIDEVLTLADGGEYILIELPNDVFIDVEPLLAELASMGIQSIISHAERIAALATRPEILWSWFELSAQFQITASNLIGEFGQKLEQTAWDFLTSGRATLVATDSHDINFRRPRMKAAFRRISTVLNHDVARLVCIENPSRVLLGKDILPVQQCSSKEVQG